MECRGEEHLTITPETKIGRLLEVYPALEETLIRLAPPFAKLRNPILRRTVAKVTTLRQAAKVGRVPLGKLINTLRQAAGDRRSYETTEENTSASAPPPPWLDRARISATVDGRLLIEAGEHPMAHVMTRLTAARPGEIIELITPFAPSPLIERMVKKGYAVWCDESEPECVRSYLTRLP